MALWVTGKYYFYGGTNDSRRFVWFYLAIAEPGELEDESTVVGITPINLIGWSIAGGAVWEFIKYLNIN